MEVGATIRASESVELAGGYSSDGIGVLQRVLARVQRLFCNQRNREGPGPRQNVVLHRQGVGSGRHQWRDGFWGEMFRAGRGLSDCCKTFHVVTTITP